jgi:integrase/recombinase XerD
MTTPGLSAWMSAYLAHQVREDFHPSTIAERAKVLGWLVAWCDQQGHPPGAPLDRPTIARFQQALATPDGPQGATPLRHARQATTASHLRQFGRFLVARGFQIDNPCGAVAVPRLGFALPDALLSPAQVAALLNGIDLTAPHGLRDRALVEVAYATGASSEALGRLALADLEPCPGHPHRVGAWLTIRPHFCSRAGAPIHPRRVPLGERAWSWVHRYQTDARPERAAREAWRGGSATALFLSQWGHPLHDRDVSLIVTTHLRRAGLPTSGSTRLLRHSLAVHLIDAGCDLRVVAALLGLEGFGAIRRYARASAGLLRDLHARFHPAERGLVPDVGRRAAPASPHAPAPLPPPSLPPT